MRFGKPGNDQRMNTLFNNCYQGKRVFITGHTGFKGSWLALWLTRLGADVIGYSVDIPSNPSHFELLTLPLTSVEGDIRDKTKLSNAIEKYQPDIVFHLAAQSLVRASYQNPVATFETNVMGTINVLESCRAAGNVKAILNVTSDKCYRNMEWERPYKEDDALGGYDPYSASKGAAEIMANSYRNSFFNNNEYGKTHTTLLADVRAGNVIGGGDWAKDRLIPDIVKATSRGEAVVIRNPRSTRPWQHVLEPLSGYLHLGWKLLERKSALADNWNFGPVDESHLTVQAVLDRAKKLWENITYTVQKSPENVHEANLLQLDSSKARAELHWKNVWQSDRAIERTINWYKKYYENGEVVTAEDLEEYVNDAKRSSVEWAVT